MNIIEVAAIATLGGTAIGTIGGWAFFLGKFRKTIDDSTKAVISLNADFIACRQRGIECTARTGVLMAESVKQIHEIRSDFTAHKAVVHQHHEAHNIHTSEEWRKTLLERLDRMEVGFEAKLDKMMEIFLDRVQSIEKTVIRNGNK